MVYQAISPNRLVFEVWGILLKVIIMSNALSSFVRYLADGNTVTTKQARTMFKVENVADLAYRARNFGLPVYTNRGEKTIAYRIGTPSNQFSKYLETGHLARARKTLYRGAISVSMAA